MTKHALEILDDKNLPRFKKNALTRAKDFELSKVLPEYEQFYEEVIEKNSSIAAI